MSAQPPVKVTVTDPDTGEVLGEQTVTNDYVIVCAGNRYVDHVASYANGTTVLTVKVDRGAGPVGGGGEPVGDQKGDA